MAKQIKTYLCEDDVAATSASGEGLADALNSTADSKGASLVAVHDAATKYIAADVEAALLEVKLLADAAAVAGQDTDVSGTAASGSTIATITMGGSVAAATIATPPYDVWAAAAAAVTDGVHAAYGDDAVNDFPAPINSPVAPRNITLLTAGPGWTGGDITVTGTNQFGTAAVEVLAPNAGGGATVGAVIFATITAIAKTTVGAPTTTCAVGWGDVLGLSQLPAAPVGWLTCDGVGEAGTWDAIYGGVKPTTVPNDVHNYAVMYPANVSHIHVSTGLTATDAGHIHTGPSHVHNQN